MNAPIVKLFGLVLVLFALLIAFTSRWTVFGAAALRDNRLNARTTLEQQQVDRGAIVAADGTVLARDVPAQGKTFRRTYPQDGLFAQTLGYSFVNAGQVGLEKFRNDPLSGQTGSLGSVFGQLTSGPKQGDRVVTTLDPRAQRVALRDLGSRAGSVVALDPRSGAVKVMASVPSFDPNHVPTQLARLNRQSGSPLLNRATQAHDQPGSTFKVLTAVAAIDSGRYTPNSIVSGDSPFTESGVPLANDNGSSFGPITLTRALTNSVNTVFARVGVSLGKATLADYMKRFGFYADPPLDYPGDQLVASGEYQPGSGRLLSPTSGQIDVGRLAYGQDKLNVTPLQMAMVAAAVANRGTLMRPHLTDRIVDPDGRTVQTIAPSVFHHVMSPRTARAVTAMMQNVVDDPEGTGTAARINGTAVAGKTGTAQVGATGSNQTEPWFIAFAPAAHPRVAVAVTIERSAGQFGGQVAAPIAKDVMEALLHG